MLPRRLLPWLFALTLLFGQAAAFAHALSHLDPHKAKPDHTCELCVAQAQLGGSLPSKVFARVVEATPFIVPTAAALPRGSLAVRHAPARAPPATV